MPNARENYDTDKYSNYGIKKTLCEKNGNPSVFIDNEGCLHIVLYDNDGIAEVGTHRIVAKNPPHNDEKGFVEKDGIYIHTSDSPILDKVCPCKMLPNDICGPD